MKLGCPLNLALYAVMVYGYFRWLTLTLDSPEVWLVSVAVAGLDWLGLMFLYNAWLTRRLAAALRRARFHIPPRDGKWVAAAGRIEPLGEPLVSPLSGQPSVLYAYEIYRLVDRDTRLGKRQRHGKQIDPNQKFSKQIDFFGIAQVECEVRTETGEMRLFGFPDLRSVPEDKCHGGEPRKRARDYVAQTHWRECSLVESFGSHGGMWTSEPEATAAFRHDWRANGALQKNPLVARTLSLEEGPEADAPPGDAEQQYALLRLSETRLAPGSQVVAIGRYDAVRGGLVSVAGSDGLRVRLFRGSFDEVATELAATRFLQFWGGLALLAVVNAFLYGAVWLYQRHETTRHKWQYEFQNAVHDSKTERVRILLDRGVDVNLPIDATGRTPLMDTSHPAVARLLVERGAHVDAENIEGVTALMFASRYNRIDVVRVLIAAGADLKQRSERYHRTAFDEALNSENAACAELLLAAEAEALRK